MQTVPIIPVEGARPCLEKFNTMCVGFLFGVHSTTFIARFTE
ncbi:hypothetical protein ES332_A05G374300v1 [Gossypium tomentosum]|uniref:Uncharacterized protein n=1 Tax=Gossypium tomentosum TaxID=34277 RepID=A0A5D2QSH3_GOSTO|nr:hypothetical protein ES332_A05G374300v1 [Gossypium tomentosum]